MDTDSDEEPIIPGNLEEHLNPIMPEEDPLSMVKTECNSLERGLLCDENVDDGEPHGISSNTDLADEQVQQHSIQCYSSSEPFTCDGDYENDVKVDGTCGHRDYNKNRSNNKADSVDKEVQSNWSFACEGDIKPFKKVDIDGAILFECKACGCLSLSEQRFHSHKLRCDGYKKEVQRPKQLVPRVEVELSPTLLEEDTLSLKKRKLCYEDDGDGKTLEERIKIAALEYIRCKICGSVFTTEWGIHSHRVRVHGFRRKGVKLNKQQSSWKPPTETSCCLCGDTLTTRYLLEHVRNHVGEQYLNKYPNPACPMAFPHYIAVRSHLETSQMCVKYLSSDDDKKLHPSKTLFCEICNVSAINCERLLAHLNRDHEKDPLGNDLPCPIPSCTEKFAVRQSVELHLYLRHDQSTQRTFQKCSRCKKNVKTDWMENHLEIEHGVRQVYRCSHCTFVFEKHEYVLDHLEEEHSDSKMFFPCDICRSVGDQKIVIFTAPLTLRKHYFNEHQVGQRFVCENTKYCSKTFWRKQDLDTHRKVRHHIFVCDICEESFTSTSVVGGSSSSSSSSCITFKTEESLTSHQINMHGAEPFQCSSCEEAFDFKFKLDNHKRKVHMTGISKRDLLLL